jgi:hypothetical protein
MGCSASRIFVVRTLRLFLRRMLVIPAPVGRQRVTTAMVVVVRVLVPSWAVSAVTVSVPAPLRSPFGMLCPLQGAAQPHESRHREHVDEPIKRLVVRFAEPERERVSHLAGPAFPPGSSPIRVVVVLLRSWHVVSPPLLFDLAFALWRTLPIVLVTFSMWQTIPPGDLREMVSERDLRHCAGYRRSLDSNACWR